ncbi:MULTISPECIES: thioesterase II family protein [unclassified Streptomyces]|uniref:thioesterase II family protein n=1 Tax=unclassified Streptomyces TaxID=2593676 RepID=UPI0038214C69
MKSSQVAQELWIRRFLSTPGATSAPARARTALLVCLPHAGGSASFFFPVSRALSPALDVVAVQYPGRQDRRHETPVDDIPELARQVADALGPVDGRPVAFFGHSLGASLGFEIARLLQARGTDVCHLFASGRRAPSRTRDERVHLRDDEGLLAEVRELSGTDPRILGDPEVVRMALPALRADYRAAETYRYVPGPPLTCPITVFTGDNDPKVSAEEAGAWSAHTSAEFDLRTYPGGHFFLTDHQADMTRIIRERLASVAPQSSGSA